MWYNSSNRLKLMDNRKAWLYTINQRNSIHNATDVVVVRPDNQYILGKKSGQTVNVWVDVVLTQELSHHNSYSQWLNTL
jgi:hypothetical protein